jgi:hypothetical protein
MRTVRVTVVDLEVSLPVSRRNQPPSWVTAWRVTVSVAAASSRPVTVTVPERSSAIPTRRKALGTSSSSTMEVSVPMYAGFWDPAVEFEVVVAGAAAGASCGAPPASGTVICDVRGGTSRPGGTSSGAVSCAFWYWLGLLRNHEHAENASSASASREARRKNAVIVVDRLG